MKMERLKQLIEKRRKKSRLQKDAELMSEFQVVERGGSLWLTHCGVAFMEIASLSMVEDVAKALNMARQTAVKFGKI